MLFFFDCSSNWYDILSWNHFFCYVVFNFYELPVWPGLLYLLEGVYIYRFTCIIIVLISCLNGIRKWILHILRYSMNWNHCHLHLPPFLRTLFPFKLTPENHMNQSRNPQVQNVCSWPGVVLDPRARRFSSWLTISKLVWDRKRVTFIIIVWALFPCLRVCVLWCHARSIHTWDIAVLNCQYCWCRSPCFMKISALLMPRVLAEKLLIKFMRHTTVN